jgi:hypothetical protein
MKEMTFIRLNVEGEMLPTVKKKKKSDQLLKKFVPLIQLFLHFQLTKKKVSFQLYAKQSKVKQSNPLDFGARAALTYFGG